MSRRCPLPEPQFGTLRSIDDRASPTGRCTMPLIMIALKPSLPTACSSSAIASAGVCIGICATGVMRSAYGK